MNKELLEEWEFWRLVNYNSNFLIFEDQLSFLDLQKMNAVLDYNEDYEKAVNEYHKEEQRIKMMLNGK